MIARGRRRHIGQDNTWPGFVDALSTLLLAIIFLLSIFVLAQFFLGQALSGREEALSKLQVQVASLSNILRMEQQANEELRMDVGQLSASLRTANIERDDLGERVGELSGALDFAEAQLDAARRESASTGTVLASLEEAYGLKEGELDAERQVNAAARAEIARLNTGITALRQQLARIEAALDASELRDKESEAVIVNLGKRLNVALAAKVEELAGYRSEFFGRLRTVLGNQPGIRIEGDRFVFQSELLFTSGSAELDPLGQVELRKFAATLAEIAQEIPADLNWVLRVDGHTDKVPISTARFPSNWELSTARAISVVKFIAREGIPETRLGATGFGEFQPIDRADTPSAYRQNRRIEMRLTQR